MPEPLRPTSNSQHLQREDGAQDMGDVPTTLCCGLKGSILVWSLYDLKPWMVICARCQVSVTLPNALSEGTRGTLCYLLDVHGDLGGRQWRWHSQRAHVEVPRALVARPSRQRNDRARACCSIHHSARSLSVQLPSTRLRVRCRHEWTRIAISLATACFPITGHHDSQYSNNLICSQVCI